MVGKVVNLKVLFKTLWQKFDTYEEIFLIFMEQSNYKMYGDYSKLTRKEVAL
jgi:hypothetical protein